MLMTILSLVLEPNTYSILIKNGETNTLSSTGINKQDSFPWSGTTTLDQNLRSSLRDFLGKPDVIFGESPLTSLDMSGKTGSR